MANHLDLEEQEQLDQLKHFWNTWGTLISSLALLVFGSIAAWNGYQYWQNRQATQAAALFDAVDVASSTGDQARMEQAFGDLRSKYSGTTQTAQAGLILAKTLLDVGNIKGAREALTWVAEKANDDGYKALARLRLSSVLMDLKELDEALKQVSGSFPAEFEAVVADRKGDILMLQGKPDQAVAEYRRAFKAFDDRVEYRRLVEVKLNALGVHPQGAAMAEVASDEVKK
jgi:predicted negative regulator of RcsB-dependent stress response